MDQMYICKNGLVYSKDLQTVLGVDTSNSEFTGTVPYGAHYIEDEVFSDCPFESISLPDSMEGIGAALFENSAELRTVKLPANITQLSPFLFSGCKKLYKVTMPNVVEAFTEAMFRDCSSLDEIPFRAGIKELPDECIAGCTSLRSLVIPPTVEVIGEKAVAGCKSLLSLVLPVSLKKLADNAFDGCTSLRNIRISDDNPDFYVNEEDGCLYQRCADGDKLKVAVAGMENQQVSFFNDDLAAGMISENTDDSDLFMSDVIIEQDEDFSGDIEAGDVEFCTDETETETSGLQTAEEETFDDFEETLADEHIELEASPQEKEMIMNDITDEIFGEEAETKTENLSSQLADIMEEEDDISASEPDEEISVDELDKLFSSNNTLKTVEQVEAEKAAEDDKIDGKTKILLDSAGISKVIKCEPQGQIPDNSELFVVAEKTVNGEFTTKLENYCKRIAKIQDYKKIILISGLPVDNDEFVQFYHFYMTQKNVIFACEAPSPAKLSDYGKKICELSRISLAKEDLIEQSKNINVKNNSLVKFVIQDKYN